VVIKGLKLLLIAIAVLITMGVVAMIFAVLMKTPEVASILAIVMAIGLFVLIATMISAAAAARRRRASAVLNYLEQAVRLNLPLPRMVRAIGEGETGRFARDMSHAQQALEEGAPLAVVLGAVPQIPTRVLALVAAAEREGRLPQVLGRLMKQRQSAVQRNLDFTSFYRIYYPPVLALALVTITSLLMVLVMPKFQQIFKDFKAPLPEVTQVTLEFSRAAGPWAAVLLLLILFSLMFSALAARWRGAAYGLVEGPLGWLANHLPVMSRIRTHRALGEVLEFAADAVEAGRPIDTSLLEAAQIVANSHVREMIDRWVAAMSHGAPLPDAARDAGLPRLIYSMLGTAIQTPDLAEVLRFLGRYYSTRFSRGAAILQAAVIPFIAITMGAVVAWLALSVFLPLIRLIDTVVPYPKGL
jgi:type II secretory pathway component PulF